MSAAPSATARTQAEAEGKRASGVSDLAQVRYVRAKRAAGGEHEVATHWIATLQYAYADPSSDPKMRSWNPLGFKILDFRTEPEVVPEHSPSTVRATP